MFKFSLATSWDNGLIKKIAKLNKTTRQKRVVELYGSFPLSLTGSGRPAYRLPDVSLRSAKKHIGLAHEAGLQFNFLMNAPDFGGKERNKKWQEELNCFVGVLVDDLCVDSVTVTNVFLIKFIRKSFPKLKINLSLITGVDTVKEALGYEKLGVSKIYLNPHIVNRDFKTLRAIVKATKCEIALYANIPCLDHCSMRDQHYRFFGAASQTGNRLNKTNFDPFIANCSLQYLENPVELLRSPFIRPEDIDEYAKLGITSFKLSDRGESAEFLADTAKAYLSGKSPRNLFSLIFRDGRKIRAAFGGKKNLRIPIVIDNDKLSKLNFIENIKELTGEDLLGYYQAASELVVRFTDGKIIDKLKQGLLKIKRKKLI